MADEEGREEIVRESKAHRSLYIYIDVALNVFPGEMGTMAGSHKVGGRF